MLTLTGMLELCTACGASHAGEGGIVPGNGTRNPVYGSFIKEHPYLSGAGSGNAISGGGAIVIEANALIVNGQIRAE